MQKDNAGLREKLRLRKLVLPAAPGFVMETNGGEGRIWASCYDQSRGIVIEKNPEKAEALARQRPQWGVVEGDCIKALAAGLSAAQAPDVLDVDPYGDPWAIIEAFFESERAFAERMIIVVNDGLRQKLRTNGGWTTHTMRAAVGKFGNDALHDDYLAVCRWNMERIVAAARCKVERFTGFYGGHMGLMTHYAAAVTSSGGSR